MMARAPQTITEDGEYIEAGAELPSVDTSVVARLARAEIDALVATAKAYPRPAPALLAKKMVELATLDEETAEECIYALPRGGKVKDFDKMTKEKKITEGKAVEGPSIRLAEIAAQVWGNSRIAARTIMVDREEAHVEAQGAFLDCETNVATLAYTRRNIRRSDGSGIFSNDMIIVTSNAAQSIARRNAILAGIPKAVWNKAYAAARHVIMGDIKTLANRRAEAIKAYQKFGLSAEQVFRLIGVEAEDEIDREKLVPLRAMYRQLLNEEMTVDELVRRANAGTPTHSVIEDALNDDAPTTAEKATESSAIRSNHGADEKAGEAADQPAADPSAVASASPAETKPAAKPAKGRQASAEPKDGQKAADAPKTAAEQQNQPAATETAPKGPPALPTSIPDYDAYARKWIAEATSAAALDDQWKAERKVRYSLNLTAEDLEPLTLLYKQRLAALKGDE